MKMETTKADDFVPPRMISPKDAAQRLFSGKYLAILSSSRIRAHREFVIELARRLPNRLALLRIQARYTPGAARSTLAFTLPGDASGRDVDVIFCPNDSAGRLAFSVVALIAGGPGALAELNRKERELAESGTPPILMLEGPGDSSIQPTLERDCELVIAFLEAYHRGEITDTTQN